MLKRTGIQITIREIRTGTGGVPLGVSGMLSGAAVDVFDLGDSATEAFQDNEDVVCLLSECLSPSTPISRSSKKNLTVAPSSSGSELPAELLSPSRTLHFQGSFDELDRVAMKMVSCPPLLYSNLVYSHWGCAGCAHREFEPWV